MATPTYDVVVGPVGPWPCMLGAPKVLGSIRATQHYCMPNECQHHLRFDWSDQIEGMARHMQGHRWRATPIPRDVLGKAKDGDGDGYWRHQGLGFIRSRKVQALDLREVQIMVAAILASNRRLAPAAARAGLAAQCKGKSATRSKSASKPARLALTPR